MGPGREGKMAPGPDPWNCLEWTQESTQEVGSWRQGAQLTLILQFRARGGDATYHLLAFSQQVFAVGQLFIVWTCPMLQYKNILAVWALNVSRDPCHGDIYTDI